MVRLVAPRTVYDTFSPLTTPETLSLPVERRFPVPNGCAGPTLRRLASGQFHDPVEPGEALGATAIPWLVIA
jgi:hypothetical protein